jgi:hypothetical protein
MILTPLMRGFLLSRISRIKQDFGDVDVNFLSRISRMKMDFPEGAP